MRKRNGVYIADEGKRFVLTEEGKNNCKKYLHKTVGEPVDIYETEALERDVVNGYVKETVDPEWIECPGFKVVYDHNGYEISAGNSIIFPERELAEKYLFNKQPRIKEPLFIRDAIYKGKKLLPCKETAGKMVYNESWYFGIDALFSGDYVVWEIVDELMNCLPPAYMSKSCAQLGEPMTHKLDKNTGILRSTYATFKEIDDGVWEYCGACFHGENVAR